MSSNTLSQFDAMSTKSSVLIANALCLSKNERRAFDRMASDATRAMQRLLATEKERKDAS